MASESQWSGNWGNWKRSYPGLPGLSNYSFIKLIGFVDLPDSMRAPTEISVSTGLASNDYQLVRRYFDTDLDNSSVRARYFNGDLSNAYARTGMAVVISKSEKRAAFVDLRPLLAYYKQQYFGQSQSGFNGMIANRGTQPSQWPYTFDVAPSQKPSVVKVMDLDNRPTAVKVALAAPFRAFIATQEGKLRVFDLGSGYLNQQAGGTPSDIVERFSVTVGRNPTGLAYAKEKAAPPKEIYPNSVEREMIVTSRGDPEDPVGSLRREHQLGVRGTHAAGKPDGRSDLDGRHGQPRLRKLRAQRGRLRRQGHPQLPVRPDGLAHQPGVGGLFAGQGRMQAAQQRGLRIRRHVQGPGQALPRDGREHQLMSTGGAHTTPP